MGYSQERWSQEERYQKNRAAQLKYLSNPEKKRQHYERVKARDARVRAEQLEMIAQIKDVPCPDCGGRFPAVCMDFDHVRGVKSWDVGSRLGKVGTERLLEEIAKCDVVCSNCHRIRTRDRILAKGIQAVEERA